MFEVFLPNEDIFSCLQKCNKIAWGITESILSHFFSPYFIDYYYEDVLWFLKLVNTKWKFIPSGLLQGSVGMMDSQCKSVSETSMVPLHSDCKVSAYVAKQVNNLNFVMAMDFATLPHPYFLTKYKQEAIFREKFDVSSLSFPLSTKNPMCL